MSARMTGYRPPLVSDNESDEDTSHSLHQNISKLRHPSDTESSDEQHPMSQSPVSSTKYNKEFRYVFMGLFFFAFWLNILVCMSNCFFFLVCVKQNWICNEQNLCLPLWTKQKIYCTMHMASLSRFPVSIEQILDDLARELTEVWAW